MSDREKKTKGTINIKQVQRSYALRTNDGFIKESVFATCFGADGERTI